MDKITSPTGGITNHWITKLAATGLVALFVGEALIDKWAKVPTAWERCVKEVTMATGIEYAFGQERPRMLVACAGAR